MQIQFGIELPTIQDGPEFARRVESLGFDYVVCGEHVAFHNPMPNSLIALAAAAGVTQRIRLMSAVLLLPLYPPALAAKMVATLDIVARGRLDLGVGLGGEYPREFEACGVPLSERGARVDEALEVMKLLWSGKPVSFSGRFSRFEDVSLRPRPNQRPHPPIWIAGRSQAAMRRAALLGQGWLPYMVDPQQYKESVDAIKTTMQSIGRSEKDFRFGLSIFASVQNRSRQAREGAVERLNQVYGQDFSVLVDRFALAGTPAECRRRIDEFIQAGVRTFVFRFGCRRADNATTLRGLVEQVIPAYR